MEDKKISTELDKQNDIIYKEKVLKENELYILNNKENNERVIFFIKILDQAIEYYQCRIFEKSN